MQEHVYQCNCKTTNAGVVPKDTGCVYAYVGLPKMSSEQSYKSTIIVTIFIDSGFSIYCIWVFTLAELSSFQCSVAN